MANEPGSAVAGAAAPAPAAMGQGVLLVGSHVAVKANSFRRRNGETATEGVVSVMLPPDSVVRVSFPTLEAAQAAVSGLAVGDVLMIPVRAQGAWDSERNRRGSVSYSAVGQDWR